MWSCERSASRSEGCSPTGLIPRLRMQGLVQLLRCASVSNPPRGNEWGGIALLRSLLEDDAEDATVDSPMSRGTSKSFAEPTPAEPAAEVTPCSAKDPEPAVKTTEGPSVTPSGDVSEKASEAENSTADPTDEQPISPSAEATDLSTPCSLEVSTLTAKKADEPLPESVTATTASDTADEHKVLPAESTPTTDALPEPRATEVSEPAVKKAEEPSVPLTEDVCEQAENSPAEPTDAQPVSPSAEATDESAPCTPEVSEPAAKKAEEPLPESVTATTASDTADEHKAPPAESTPTTDALPEPRATKVSEPEDVCETEHRPADSATEEPISPSAEATDESAPCTPEVSEPAAKKAEQPLPESVTATAANDTADEHKVPPAASTPTTDSLPGPRAADASETAAPATAAEPTASIAVATASAAAATTAGSSTQNAATLPTSSSGPTDHPSGPLAVMLVTEEADRLQIQADEWQSLRVQVLVSLRPFLQHLFHVEKVQKHPTRGDRHLLELALLLQQQVTLHMRTIDDVAVREEKLLQAERKQLLDSNTPTIPSTASASSRAPKVQHGTSPRRRGTAASRGSPSWAFRQAGRARSQHMVAFVDPPSVPASAQSHEASANGGRHIVSPPSHGSRNGARGVGRPAASRDSATTPPSRDTTATAATPPAPTPVPAPPSARRSASKDAARSPVHIRLYERAKKSAAAASERDRQAANAAPADAVASPNSARGRLDREEQKRVVDRLYTQRVHVQRRPSPPKEPSARWLR